MKEEYIQTLNEMSKNGTQFNIFIGQVANLSFEKGNIEEATEHVLKTREYIKSFIKKDTIDFEL